MQNGPPDSPRSSRSQGGSEASSASVATVKAAAASGLADPLLGLSSGSGSGTETASIIGSALPTLHEDAEFTADVKALPLTLSTLHLTERKRAEMKFDVRPLPGHYPG